MFRFIHTADVHLDSPLLSLALKDPEAADLVANATRQSFSRTIDLCLEESVNALLIAGDLYDGALKSMKTAAFVTREFRRLTDAGIRVFMIRGNHDAESRITKHLALPEGVHLFSGRADAVQVEGHDIVVSGVSFAKPHAPESLLPKYKPPASDAIHIGLLHTSLGGAPAHDVYAPCSLQDLRDFGYDYWALGHIHMRDVHRHGSTTIVMPGMPQGRHVNEAGPKSVTLGQFDGNRDLMIEERHTSLAEFARVTVDLTHIDNWSDMIGRVEEMLGSAADDAHSPHVIARVELRGGTSLASRLRRDGDVLLEEVREAGRRSGALLVESIACNASLPQAGEASPAGDPVRELRELMANDRLDRSNAIAQTRILLQDLQTKLPHELRDRFDSDDTLLLERYLTEGSEDVLARLEASEPDV